MGRPPHEHQRPRQRLVTPDGAHAVGSGSENRQNLLGHIGLVGASVPMLPFGSGGAPEGQPGGPVDASDGRLALRTPPEQGGLAVAVHFPLPYGARSRRTSSQARSTRRDASPHARLEGPSIREWYRFLDCGYRLPMVGGPTRCRPRSLSARSGRMRASTPGAASHSMRVEAEQYERAGLRLVRDVRGSGGRELRAGRRRPAWSVTAGPSKFGPSSAAQAVIDGLELIHDGAVVAVATGGGIERVTLSETSPGLDERLAGCPRDEPGSRSTPGFSTSMGAHELPVYVDVPGEWASVRAR